MLLKVPDATLDLPTILSSAHSLGFREFFDKKEEYNHLRAVMNFSTIQKESVRKLAAKLRKLEIANQIYNLLEESKTSLKEISGDEPISHILGLVEKPIFDFSTLLNSENNEGPKLILKNLREKIEHRFDNPIKQVGLSSGFPLYDEIIGGGFRRGTVNVVLARLKAGKSSFADNVAIHQITQPEPVPVLMLDTEMSEDEHEPRILANLSGVDIKLIETGQAGLDPEKRRKVLEATDLLNNKAGNYYFYQNICGWETEDIISYMRRWLHRHVGFDSTGLVKPCLIILDYLKIMSNNALQQNREMKEYQALGFMTTSLVNFMQKYKVPLATYCQVNRDGISKEDTDIVAGSDRIGWFASNLVLLKRQTTEEMAEQHGFKDVYNSKLVYLAARHGPGLDDDDFINFKFNRYICKFTEGPLQSERARDNSAGQVGEITTDDDIDTTF